MVKQNGRVVVEIDGPQNESFYFRPLRRRIRGRLDPRRLPEPGRLLQRFPEGVPGQRLELDYHAATGAIVEPLHLPEFAAVAAEAKKKASLPPARLEFKGVNRDDWAHYLAAQVKAGLAKVVEGELPDYDPTKVVPHFVTTPPPNPIDKLVAALERQNDLLVAVLKGRA